MASTCGAGQVTKHLPSASPGFISYGEPGPGLEQDFCVTVKPANQQASGEPTSVLTRGGGSSTRSYKGDTVALAPFLLSGSCSPGGGEARTVLAGRPEGVPLRRQAQSP